VQKNNTTLLLQGKMETRKLLECWMTGRHYLINNAGQTYNDTGLATLTIDMQARVKAGVALVLYGITNFREIGIG